MGVIVGRVGARRARVGGERREEMGKVSGKKKTARGLFRWMILREIINSLLLHCSTGHASDDDFEASGFDKLGSRSLEDSVEVR